MRRHLLVVRIPSLIACLWLTSCQDRGAPTTPGVDAAADAPQLVRQQGAADAAFTTEFHPERCTFSATGRNPFFILEPGYRQVLEGTDEGTRGRLVIRVLDATRTVGGVRTRVVEERHFEDGELVEISLNFFAICQQNNSVFYFGETTDIYVDGEIVSHEGAWLHGVDGARRGVIMPGLPLLGAKYFQEIAPGVALDRAEVIALDGTVRTPLRRFTGALMTRESTPLDPGAIDIKAYALDVGLIQDGALLLVSAGFRGREGRDDIGRGTDW